MKSLKFVRSGVVALAALGVVCPQLTALAAGPKSAAKPIIRTVAANSVMDIGLTQGGTFTGRVVDQTGAALEGAEVVVKQGKTEVSRTITDKQGSFVAKNLKGGVYTVASGPTEGTYRVWAEKSAPPSAKSQALLVMGQNGARGQCGGCDGCDSSGSCIGPVLLVGAVAAGAIGLGYGLGWAAGTPPASP